MRIEWQLHNPRVWSRWYAWRPVFITEQDRHGFRFTTLVWREWVWRRGWTGCRFYRFTDPEPESRRWSCPTCNTDKQADDDGCCRTCGYPIAEPLLPPVRIEKA